MLMSHAASTAGAGQSSIPQPTTGRATGGRSAGVITAVGIAKRTSPSATRPMRGTQRSRFPFRAGTYIDPDAGRVTFREYAEEWRKNRVHDLATATRIEIAFRNHAYA